nr:MAG TPA: hypothetical protein [Caudoviricetes sp.]
MERRRTGQGRLHDTCSFLSSAGLTTPPPMAM